MMRDAESQFDSDAGPVLVSDILASGAAGPLAIQAVAVASLATLFPEPHSVAVRVDPSGGGWLVVTVSGPRTSGQLVLER
jgi:hypothetical protein